jgi:hypothetical protein
MRRTKRLIEAAASQRLHLRRRRASDRPTRHEGSARKERAFLCGSPLLLHQWFQAESRGVLRGACLGAKINVTDAIRDTSVSVKKLLQQSGQNVRLLDGGKMAAVGNDVKH